MPRRRPDSGPALRRVRLAFQFAVVAAAAVTGVRFAAGLSPVSVETYCPFGGLETAWAFVTHRRFTCAAGATNLALFLALVALAFLARKAFCGWACPVGALSEWQARWAGRLFRRRGPARGSRIGPRLDAALQVGLRLVVLAVILGATWATGELVFRGYDPYYIVFSANGHDVRTVSWIVLGALVALGFAAPMAWCRYLCPLGAVLWPFARFGRLRLARHDARCSTCGLCDRKCPQGIDVSNVAVVRSGDCTLCLECTEACPVDGALELHWEGGRR